MKKIYLLVALAFGISAHTIAQEGHVTIIENEQQAIGVQYGLDYSFGTMGLSYQRGVTLLNKDVIVGAELAFPLFKMDLGDYRLHFAKIQGSVYRKRNFDVTVMYSPTLIKNENKVQNLMAWGHEAGVRFGFYGPKWGVGSKVAISKQFATRIEHTDYFKTIVYEDAKDGWYKSTGGNIRFSLEGARRLGDWDVKLQLGLAKTLQLESHLLVPAIYGVIGGTYRF